MADNILTKDRDDADIALAAKDLAGVLTPRNIISDPSGADITPLTDEALRAVPVPVSCSALSSLADALHTEDTAHVSGDMGQLMLGIRRDADTPTADDGDYTVMKVDEAGRLKVSTMPASYPAVVGDISAIGGTVFIDCQRFSGIALQVHGTFSTVNCTFEVSNNSTNGVDGNWGVLQAARSNANTAEITTGNLSASPAYLWEVSVNPYKWFRIRCTARTSGTQTWTLVPGSYATEVTPVVQVTGTQPVSLVSPTNASIISSAATTNGTIIKGAAGNVYGIIASNSGATSAYVKLHNSTTVTAGTTAVAMWIKIGAGETVRFDWGPLGARFSTGVCMSITGAVADNDTTAVALAQVKVITSFI